MRSLIAWITASIVGAIGWWAGDMINVTAAIILSGIGTGFGFWLGRRIVKEYMGG